MGVPYIPPPQYPNLAQYKRWIGLQPVWKAGHSQRTDPKVLKLKLASGQQGFWKSCNSECQAMHPAWQLCLDLRGKIWKEFVPVPCKDKNPHSVHSGQKAENESSGGFVPLPLGVVLLGSVSVFSSYLLRHQTKPSCSFVFLQISFQPSALRGLGSRHWHGENEDFRKLTNEFEN